MTVGKEADVADAMKTAGHSVLQEATDELIGGERHHLSLAVLTIVLPGEADLTIVEPDQTAVGDGDAVSVAPEIAEHLLGSGKRGFCEDDPVGLGQHVDPGGEVGGNSQCVESAKEVEFTIREGSAKPLQEQIAEAAGERTDGEEEAGWASDPARLVGRDAAAGDDAV
jgi:hypothetical protein